jgi:hypothetical protein
MELLKTNDFIKLLRQFTIKTNFSRFVSSWSLGKQNNGNGGDTTISIRTMLLNLNFIFIIIPLYYTP